MEEEEEEEEEAEHNDDLYIHSPPFLINTHTPTPHTGYHPQAHTRQKTQTNTHTRAAPKAVSALSVPRLKGAWKIYIGKQNHPPDQQSR
jgi:hypothetical protein